MMPSELIWHELAPLLLSFEQGAQDVSMWVMLVGSVLAGLVVYAGVAVVGFAWYSLRINTQGVSSRHVSRMHRVSEGHHITLRMNGE